jgi:hypothetical protein
VSKGSNPIRFSIGRQMLRLFGPKGMIDFNCHLLLGIVKFFIDLDYNTVNKIPMLELVVPAQSLKSVFGQMLF